MRGTADLGGVAATAAVSNATPVVAIGDQGRDVLARFERIILGQRLPAVLHSRLADGNFEVSLAGTTLRMALPAGMQVGQRIELTLLAREPRPTFLLNAPAGAVHAEVSQAGRLIDTLLRVAQPERGAAANLPKALVDATQPVVNAPVTQSDTLARALANALSNSGLFYESHVAQWVSGGRSQAQLAQEPQFGWNAENLAKPGARQPPKAGAAAAAAAKPAPAEASLSKLSPLPSAPVLNIDPTSEAAQMMRLQLETLEHSQVLWRGEAWPGLSMEWGVAADGEPNAQTQERSWQSVLRFHFDKLGTVAATINLSGGEVQLALRAESGEVAQQLRGAAAELADALRGAGTPLHVMTVKQEDAP